MRRGRFTILDVTGSEVSKRGSTDSFEKIAKVLKKYRDSVVVYDSKTSNLYTYSRGKVQIASNIRKKKRSSPFEPEEFEKQNTGNPINEKIREFRQKVNDVRNAPSVTKGQTLKIRDLFDNIFRG